MKIREKIQIQKLLIILILIFLAGCFTRPKPLLDQPLSSNRQNKLTAIPFTLTPTPTKTPVPTSTFTPTITPTGTATETPMPTSRYSLPRATVLAEKLSCNYGPGGAYLYKFGLVGGSVLEVIGRNATGSWVLLRAIGGNNPCWASSAYLEFDIDIMPYPVVDYHIIFPFTYLPSYYVALKNVFASREGEKVHLSWSGITLIAGDDSLQYLYLVEAWVCQDGFFVFLPRGTYQTGMTITDQKGCAAQSKVRVYGVEKHGYTPWFELPLPLFEDPQTATPVSSPTIDLTIGISSTPTITPSSTTTAESSP